MNRYKTNDSQQSITRSIIQNCNKNK